MLISRVNRIEKKTPRLIEYMPQVYQQTVLCSNIATLNFSHMAPHIGNQRQTGDSHWSSTASASSDMSGGLVQRTSWTVTTVRHRRQCVGVLYKPKPDQNAHELKLLHPSAHVTCTGYWLQTRTRASAPLPRHSAHIVLVRRYESCRHSRKTSLHKSTSTSFGKIEDEQHTHTCAHAHTHIRAPLFGKLTDGASSVIAALRAAEGGAVAAEGFELGGGIAVEEEDCCCCCCFCCCCFCCC